MPFRETRAWLQLVTIIVAYIPYFLFAPVVAEIDPATVVQQLAWFAAASLARALLFGVGIVAITRRTPKVERARPDERDRAVDRRAASIAYYVLMAEAVLVGIVMPFGRQGWSIINATLLAIIVAESVRQTIIIYSYRRGWHG